MRTLSPPLATTLLAIVALSACKKESAGPAAAPEYVLTESTAVASEENPQAVNGDTFEDYFYAFTLRRPGDRWQFLTEEKAQSINPDATMAMMCSKKSAFFAVIVDQLDFETLDEYAELIFSDDSVFAGVEVERRKVGLLEAAHVEKQTTVSGAAFTYRATVLKRGNFFYQVLGWAQTARYADASADIESIITSFRPVDGRKPTLRQNLTTPDADGFGWRVRDRVYSNAAAGFRLPCPEGCRIMDASELLSMNDSADAGVAGGFSEFFLLWSSEHAPDANTIDQIGREITAIEGTAGAERQVTIGGHSAREVEVVDAKGDNGLALEHRISSVYVDGIAHRLHGWWEPKNREAALTLLEKCYAGVEWLPDEEREKLVGELNSADRGNASGIDFGLRNRTFYDFAHGFRLSLPEDQLFETETTATVSEEEMQGSRLSFSNLNNGTYCMVYAGSLDDYDSHAAYHADEMTGFDDVGEARTLKIGNRELVVSSFKTETDGTDLSQSFASTAYGENQVVEFWLTLVGGGRGDDLDAQLRELIPGLETPNGGLEEIDKSGGKIVDRRLGYQVDTPRGWKANHLHAPGVEALASSVTLERKGTQVGFMAICSPMGLDLDLAVNGVVQNSGFEVDAGSMTKTPAKLGGLAGERTVARGRFNGRRSQVFIWTALRANTGYLCYLIDEKNTMSKAEAEKVASYMLLLD